MEPIAVHDPLSQSADLTAENIERLRELFPQAVTEDADPNGAVSLRIDFDVLRELLGGELATGEEKYGLNWHGKRAARRLALTPSTGTLRPAPEESVDWDTTQNLMIEGDNLEVLKLLQKSYADKVKMIYIDPPYNTGKDFVYKDDFRDSIGNYLRQTKQVDTEGVSLSNSNETSGRLHTDWLNMMYPRLLLARTLLKEDGVIFCSIDDVEAPRLRELLESVFGEENFLASFSWVTDGNFDNQAKIKITHEYVLLFAKNSDTFPHPPVIDPSTPSDSKLFLPEIRNTIVKNGPKNPVSAVTLPSGFPADFAEGEIQARDKSWPIYRNRARIIDGRLSEDTVVESGWASKDLLVEFIKADFKPILDSKGQQSSFVITRSGAIEVVKQRSDFQSHVISNLSGFGGTQSASAALLQMGAFFNGYPKPVELIRYFVQMNHGRDGLYLDFFSGSGPCAQAVLEQNVVDGGKRAFILVQLPQELRPYIQSEQKAAEYCAEIGKPLTIAELTKERLRRTAAKIKSENPMFHGDLGFRVFKLNTTSIRPWDPTLPVNEQRLLGEVDNILPERTEQDLLYELLLKRGIYHALTAPILKRTFAERQVFAVSTGDLIACLAPHIETADVEPLAHGIVEWHKELAPPPASDPTAPLEMPAKVQPPLVVFRDTAFADDVAKSNLTEILKQHGLTDVRSL